MKSKTIRFGRAIVLSIFLFTTIFSLPGMEHDLNSIWRGIHIGAGSLLLIASTVHLITNLKWLKSVLSHPGGTLPRRLRLNRTVDLGLVISGAICILTSVHWLIDPRSPVNHLHGINGFVFIVLLGTHMLLHWNWMVNTARQMRQLEMAN